MDKICNRDLTILVSMTSHQLKIGALPNIRLFTIISTASVSCPSVKSAHSVEKPCSPKNGGQQRCTRVGQHVMMIVLTLQISGTGNAGSRGEVTSSDPRAALCPCCKLPLVRIGHFVSEKGGLSRSLYCVHSGTFG